MNTVKALYWEANGNNVKCLLCPVGCDICDGHTGFCGVRENRCGTLYAESYGRISSIALDRVEKKPLYRFMPGKFVLSLGSWGCNMRCPFCQNHEISMRSAEKDTPHTRYFSPDEIAEMAESRAEDGNIGVAYTYNEPFISYEYMLDCVKLVKAKGMKNVVVTNGYVNAEPLGEILPYIDAMNIDLKGFSDDYYKMLKGGLLSVLDTITNASKSCHAELTTLIIPGENDRGSEMEAEAKWIAALNPDIPLHITRFFPRYDMKDKQPTPPETIHRLRAVAEKYLNYVYEGNMW